MCNLDPKKSNQSRKPKNSKYITNYNTIILKYQWEVLSTLCILLPYSLGKYTMPISNSSII